MGAPAKESSAHRSARFYISAAPVLKYELPANNRGRVHIECIDSTALFGSELPDERQLSLTAIVGGYLDWARSLGFEWAHVRVPPPTDSNAHIFAPRSLPVRRKVAAHMSNWYSRMMAGAKSCGIIHGFSATKDLKSTDFPLTLFSTRDLATEKCFE